MISHLKGQVLHIDLKYAIIEVNGLGYKTFVTNETLEHLSHNREQCSLWIYSAIREDAFDLYGFVNKDDLDFFESLLTISGIGPKSAIGILSVASTDTIKEAIYNDDPSYLTKVSGISKKNAEKIVRELKDKIAPSTRSDSDKKSMSKQSTESMLAIEALISLGYSADIARDTIKKVDKTVSTGEQIKLALKLLQ